MTEYWKSAEKKKRSKCTKIKCETNDGDSMEFDICIKNGKAKNCKKVRGK